jgi:hypothetical protein
MPGSRPEVSADSHRRRSRPGISLRDPGPGCDGTYRHPLGSRWLADRVISTVDPDARHTRKSPQARCDGYRAHMVADPDTGIITDETLTKAAGTDNSDPAVAGQFLANDIAESHTTSHDTTADGPANDRQPAGQPTEPDSNSHTATRREWYRDSAYGTGDLRGAIHDARHQAVIKPKPLHRPVPGGFTNDDFTSRCHPTDHP